jgi:glycosyltransferase involved in cell wall biosynthesis
MRELIPHVTVAICTQRRPRLLASTLRCLAHQEYSAEHYEVLVVDNDPADETTAQVVREFQGQRVAVFYHACLTPGLSHARNAAVAESGSELIVFVDDDVVCEPSWLRTLVAPFAGDPDQRIAAVGGEVIPVYSEGVHRGGVQIYRPLRLRAQPGPIARRQMLMGANMAFRREALVEAGLFDARVGRNGRALLAGDENRPVERLRKKGFEIWFVPGARVFHELPRARTSLTYAMRHGFDSARSRVRNQTAALEDEHRSCAAYVYSRLIINTCKLPVLSLQAALLILLLQRNALGPVLVRLARTVGYQREIWRCLFADDRGSKTHDALPPKVSPETVASDQPLTAPAFPRRKSTAHISPATQPRLYTTP